MRISGGYSLHQSLTIEAGTIVKQAVSLARKRGHAQVTPLHVATAMLINNNNNSGGLLTRACLQSHSHHHPLQCKALDLCFNAALNRLPTTTTAFSHLSSSTPTPAPAPLLGLGRPQYPIPSLSNALVAAFKRAQAHQRRGGGSSTETTGHEILAMKVEIEQLVISILDDPSVSRVMREAGFSSTQVRNDVEKAVSFEKCSPPPPPQAGFSMIMSVLEAMMMNNKTRNTVIVGESWSCGESVVRGVIDKMEKKDIKFISLTLRNIISRDEFEMKLREAARYSDRGGGVVLYLGDLDWVSSFWSKYQYNCPVPVVVLEYMMIMELSRLVVDHNKRVWLMGIASFKTYANCKRGSPSLETLWSLHPLTIPAVANNLALTLSLDKKYSDDMHDQVKKEAVVDDDDDAGFMKKKQLICCWDSSDNFKKEAKQLELMTTISASTSKLPSWLQHYKDEENRKQIHVVDQEYCDDDNKIKDLCKKWNSICTSNIDHNTKKPDNDDYFLGKLADFNIPSASSSSISSCPSSSTSVSSNGDLHKPNNKLGSKNQLHINPPAVVFETSNVEYDQQIILPPQKPDLLSNPNSSPNSASSSHQDMELDHNYKFNDSNNNNNIIIIGKALEKKVPWQRCIIPEITSTILKCRTTSGCCAWLFFLGADDDGKQTIARELAKVVFGSYDNFTPIRISCFDVVDDDDDEVISSNTTNYNYEKRARIISDDQHGGANSSSYDRFVEAVCYNPSRVFYVEDADEMDYDSIKGFERAIKDGGVTSLSHQFVPVKDAIVIFSCENFNARPKQDKKQENNDHHDLNKCQLLDLNIATHDDSNGNGNDDSSVLVSEIGILDLVHHKVEFNIKVL